MVRFGKKVAVLTLAGAIAAMSVTGCGSIKEDATVATVGEEKITLGVANFYAQPIPSYIDYVKERAV